jgi:hypothetical protein
VCSSDLEPQQPNLPNRTIAGQIKPLSVIVCSNIPGTLQDFRKRIGFINDKDSDQLKYRPIEYVVVFKNQLVKDKNDDYVMLDTLLKKSSIIKVTHKKNKIKNWVEKTDDKLYYISDIMTSNFSDTSITCYLKVRSD